MKQSRIDEIVRAYCGDGFTEQQLRQCRLACENVESESRHEAVRSVYDFAKKLAKPPGELT